MGDVILSTAALDAVLTRSPGARISWVVASEFAPLLAEDPRIAELVIFDRKKQGLRDWHRLFRGLLLGPRLVRVPSDGNSSDEGCLDDAGFDEVIDLHGSLRTRYARSIFAWHRLTGAIARQSSWRVLPKQRWQRAGYFLFKRLWPKWLRPAANGGYARRVADFCADGNAKASRSFPRLAALEAFPHGAAKGGSHRDSPGAAVGDALRSIDPAEGPLVCVMPGAAWRGKCLPTAKWVRAMGEFRQVQWVILGRPGERPSEDLLKVASRAGLKVLAAFRALDLLEQAAVVRRSQLLVGNDTGMIHLAEALGVPVVSLFGPTRDDLGFGPWKGESMSVQSTLWCSPCSKDGSACFRLGRNRFLCQQSIRDRELVTAIRTVLGRGAPGAEARPASRGERAATPMSVAYRAWARGVSRFVRGLLEVLSFGRRRSWNWRRHPGIEPIHGRRLIWLHAASAGELEMLWPLAEDFERQGFALALSVFSPSGRLGVERFRERFLPRYAGPSPWEGEWHEFFNKGVRVVPEAIVTSKYEAWPELWGSAAEAGIPLFIINADDRPSLRFAARWVGRIFGRTPEVNLATIDEASRSRLEASPLKRLMSTSPAVLGDPRWDRVAARLSDGSARARTLFSRAVQAGLARPWLVVGSAWPEDLRFLLPEVRKLAPELTVWVVPHAVHGKPFDDCIETIQREWPGAWVRSSQWEPASGGKGRPPTSGPIRLVVVDELGVLVELYAQAGLAWVGGGFRTGLHSVVEPALAGIPVACGPWGASRFPEVSALESTGQLRVVEDARALGDWIDFALAPRSGQAEVWRDAYQLGAARRCSNWILQRINPN